LILRRSGRGGKALAILKSKHRYLPRRRKKLRSFDKRKKDSRKGTGGKKRIKFRSRKG